MAYPKSRGENPLNYEEYDPTPFSGGYDQVAFYGRPKSPSAETCYPKSEIHPHQGGDYGGDYSGKPSRPKYAVDEDRPTFHEEDPPHTSDDEYTASGYGRKPHSSSYEGGGYGSGYSRPEPPSYEEDGGGYGSGYGGRIPSSYAELEQEVYGRPKPPSYGVEEEEGGFGSGFGRRPNPPHEEGGPGYGEYGFGRPQGEGYGGFGDQPPHEDDRFGHGGRRRPEHEGEGVFGGRPHRFGGEEEGEEGEGGFGGRRPGGFGRDEEGPGYFGDEPPRPPPEEGFGGYQGEEHHHGRHHKHHWGHHDDE